MPEGYELYKAAGGAPYKPASQFSGDPSTFPAMMQMLAMFNQQKLLGQRNNPYIGPKKTDATEDVCNISSPNFDPVACLASGGEVGLGEGSGGLVSGTLPPVTDILGEMRLRRQAEAQQAGILAEIIGSNVPRGAEYYPGFEPGGVADVLLGIITGKGPSVAEGILGDTRRVKRTAIPVPEGQPTVGEEFGGASGLAGSILGAGKVIQ